MKPVRAIWIAGVLAVAVPPPCAPAFLQDWEVDSQRISETGQEIFNVLAPAAIKENYEFASPEQIAAFFAPFQAALAGESLGNLAAMHPRARETLAALRANPDQQGYADWLEARMDFFEMAAEVEKTLPAPPPPRTTPATRLPPHPAPAQKPLPPHPPPPGKPLPPHPKEPTPKPTLIPHPKEPVTASPPSTPVAAPAPATPAAPVAPGPGNVEQARNRYVESKDVWLRKLASRPMPPRAAALLPELKRIFQAEGVPPALVWQAEAESTFNPAARSPVGAVGLYQFMPATAQQFGLKLTPEDERLDAYKNARAAARYLKLLHGRFGNWPLALAAYNCGQGRVSKLLAQRGGRTFNDIHDKLPAETRMYVPKIAALVQIRENTDIEKL